MASNHSGSYYVRLIARNIIGGFLLMEGWLIPNSKKAISLIRRKPHTFP